MDILLTSLALGAEQTRLCFSLFYRPIDNFLALRNLFSNPFGHFQTLRSQVFVVSISISILRININSQSSIRFDGRRRVLSIALEVYCVFPYEYAGAPSLRAAYLPSRWLSLH
jgi:hypothetical protein